MTSIEQNFSNGKKVENYGGMGMPFGFSDPLGLVRAHSVTQNSGIAQHEEIFETYTTYYTTNDPVPVDTRSESLSPQKKIFSYRGQTPESDPLALESTPKTTVPTPHPKSDPENTADELRSQELYLKLKDQYFKKYNPQSQHHINIEHSPRDSEILIIENCKTSVLTHSEQETLDLSVLKPTQKNQNKTLDSLEHYPHPHPQDFSNLTNDADSLMLSPAPLVPNGSAKKLTIAPRRASPRPDVSPFEAKMTEECKIVHGKDKDYLENVGNFFHMLEKKSSGYLVERNDDLSETGKDGQSDGKEILWEGSGRGLGGRGTQGQELIGKGDCRMGMGEVEKFKEHVRGVVSRCTLELEKIEKKSLGEGVSSSLERKLTKNLLEFGAVRQSQQIAQEKK